MASISLLFPDTGMNSVITAAAVCVVMATTLVLLMRQAAAHEERHRHALRALVVGVAGVGVWTTHFVAVLGYRPDAALVFNAEMTVASVLAGLFCVGIPLALGSAALRRGTRSAWGAVAGLGVGAMHYVGMSALEGCTITNNPVVAAISLMAGAVPFAASMALSPTRLYAVRAALFVTGVCALHFTALAGVSLTPTGPATVRAIGIPLLSSFVAVASVALSVAAYLAIAAMRRLNDERQHVAEAEEHQNRLFSTAMRNMSNGLVMFDQDETIIAFNDQAVDMMQLEPGTLAKGHTLADMFCAIARVEGWSEERKQARIADYRGLLVSTEITRMEIVLACGKVLRISCRPMPDGGAVLTYDDVTERHKAELAVTKLAYGDVLTGLPNRRSFQERVAKAIATDGPTTIVLLDLDRFKAINDTLGHHIGDLLLVEVAERLKTLVPADCLFRLGGDELAVLPDSLETVAACGSSGAVITELNKPFVIRGHHITIGVSIGIAEAEIDESADVLLQKADLALYRAKALGRNRAEAYEPGLMEQAQERRELELDLAGATERGELVLEYQPLFELPGRRLTGFEALLRWDHPVRGRVSPDGFIPLSEENGMIIDIGAWVIEEVCRQASRWPAHIHVALNMSPVQMRSPGVVELLSSAIARHGVEPSRLEIELTETAMVQDGEAIAETLRAIRRLGIRIAMDDFGTGYSSLAHLRQFELDRIKIDRSFVGVAADDRDARAVVRAVTSMAREMSIMTIGEGVETIDQLDRLIDLGCDHAQGYFLGRALTSERAGELIAVAEFEDDAKADASTDLPTHLIGVQKAS